MTGIAVISVHIHDYACLKGQLTLGAHAQRGLQYLVCLSVCPSATTFLPPRSGQEAIQTGDQVERTTPRLFRAGSRGRGLRGHWV